jgi:hypothetical protein
MRLGASVTTEDKERVVSEEQWLADCSLLLTAAMYGNPPGGWSDPERRAEFKTAVAKLEWRMRAAQEGEPR